MKPELSAKQIKRSKAKKAFELKKKQGRLNVKEKLWLLQKEDRSAAIRLRKTTTKVIPVWWVPRSKQEKFDNLKKLNAIKRRKNAVLAKRRAKRFVFFNTKRYILRKGSRRGLRKARDTFYRRLAQSNHSKKLNRLKKREEKAKAQGK